MDIYELKHPVKVFCVEAQSFPGGIKAAFDQLQALAPDTANRHIFGISKPQNGLIIYKAAATEKFEGEGIRLGYPTFTISDGFYLTETLIDWQDNEMMIMGIFNRLIADRRLDGSAHCIEWYKNDRELLCMVLMRSGGEITETIKQLTI